MNLAVLAPFPPWRGGIARHAAETAAALEARGHSVTRLTYVRLYPSALYPGRSPFAAEGGPPDRPAAAVLDVFDPRTWAVTLRRVEQSGARALLIPWWTPLPALPVAWLAARLPVIHLVHNALPHETLPLQRVLTRLALGRGRGWITHSLRQADDLRSLYHVPAERIRSTSHPPFPPAGPLPERTAARAGLNLPPERPLALFFGLVRPYKGLDVLIDALGLLKAAGRELPFTAAVGELWLPRRRFEQQAARLGLAADLRLADGYCPEEQTRAWLAAADFLAAPYRSGTQSGAVRLAQGHGMPVIATPPAGLEGFPPAALQTVPAGDAPALADALCRWTQEPPPRLPPCQPGEGWQPLAALIEELAG